MNGIEIYYDKSPIGLRESLYTNSNCVKDNLTNVKNLSRQPMYDKYFGNPCEEYSVILDGKTSAIPNVGLEPWENFGFIGCSKTDLNGEFSEPVEITLGFRDNINIDGITIYFDEANEIYPSEMEVHIYDINKEDPIVKNIYPESPVVFIPLNYQFYEISIRIPSLNMPGKRLYVHHIVFGEVEKITGEELKNLTITDELDDISISIPIGVFDFTFENKGDRSFLFEKKHHISVYYDGEGKFFGHISDIKRKSRTLYDLTAEDYIGLLEATKFYGGIYTNEPIINILEEIQNISGVYLSLDQSYSDELISGWLPISTCREALNKLAFVLGAEVDSSSKSTVSISKPKNDVSQEILNKRQMPPQTMDEKTGISEIDVSNYNFVKGKEEKSFFESNSEDDIGKEIFVQHSNPAFDISGTNCDIISGNANYTVIKVNAIPCILKGYLYVESKNIHKKFVSGFFNNIVISIDDVKLVNSKNVDKILSMCYDYFENEKYINTKIIEGKKEIVSKKKTYGNIVYNSAKYGELNEIKIEKDKPISLGDILEIETEYMGKKIGRVLSQKYNLNGGIIVKDVKIKVLRDA